MLELLNKGITLLSIFLVVFGGLGYFRVVKLVPRALSSRHVFQQKLALSLMLAGGGLFLAVSDQGIFPVLGLILGIAGAVFFGILYSLAGKEDPTHPHSS
ncbi:MAG: hypothetical protein WA116_04440 [Anaerolineaceae bacterium]